MALASVSNGILHSNWLYTELTGLDQKITLQSIDCILGFSEVFRRIGFEKLDEGDSE